MERIAVLSPADKFFREELKRQDPGVHPLRVMLMTSSLGTGHSRAALAIEREIKARMPECVVQTVDFWSLIDPAVARAIKDTYLRLVTDHPDLYHRLYNLDQRCWRQSFECGQALPALLNSLHRFLEQPAPGMTGAGHALDRFLFRQLGALLKDRSSSSNAFLNAIWREKALTGSWRLLADRLRRKIRQFRPDALVATQVNMGALAANLKNRRKIVVPLMAVPTDYGIHDFWIQESIDSYCIADDSMESAGMLQSRSRGQINVTGIPLMPEFADLPSTKQARQHLGLEPDRPVILILGGGLGLGVADIVGTLAQRLDGSESEPVLVVLAGRNPLVSSELKRQPATARALERRQIQAHGWTDRMAVFIRSADLVVGKPGGLTTAEVLACGRPLFSTSCLRGQESFNVDYLENNNVGRLLPAEELSRQVLGLLDDRTGLERMHARAWSLGKRNGATSVVARVLESARNARREGTWHAQ